MGMDGSISFYFPLKSLLSSEHFLKSWVATYDFFFFLVS